MNPLLLHLEKGHLPQGKRSHLISFCLLARLPCGSPCRFPLPCNKINDQMRYRI
jgi:hypothetical protein